MITNSHKNIAVIGGGSWGTAIVKILSDNIESKTINWWMRDLETINHINTYAHNPRYISSVQIDISKVKVSNDLQYVVNNSDIIILVIPSAFIGTLMPELKLIQFDNKILISAIKGLVAETGDIPGIYFSKILNLDISSIGVISGPCHAEEVALEKLSYITIASENETLCKLVKQYLQNHYIQIVLSDDIYGTEYGAVLKNIYAIASGICHGLGLGDNFQAVLISNAIREMKRFIDTIHPISRDINDSAYLGDLLVTAYSQFSRNRTFGNYIGKGYNVSTAQLEMNMVAEGYFATKILNQINKTYAVHMPILDFVYGIIYDNKLPKDAFNALKLELN